MQTIEISEKTFLLRTDHTAYLLRIDAYGHPEHVHYGAPVALADVEALAYKRTLLYGSEVLYQPGDAAYCLDNIPLEWSGMGKGDFRVPPLEAELPDGTLTTDFLFERYELHPGALPAKTLPGAYCESESDAETLVLFLREAAFSLELQLIYTVYPQVDVITRRAVLVNREDTGIRLRRMMSLLLDLPNAGYRLLTLDGDWIQETHRHDRTLMPGCFVNESTTGASSNRHNPGVALAEPAAGEDSGRVYGFNLIYSGNHYTAAELSPRNMVRVLSGINPLGFCWKLEPGAAFETPEAVMTFSEQGFHGMSCHFHDFVNRHIVRGDWKGRERPVLVNNWEAHFFDFTRRKLLRLARRAKALGAELFVLDDGWFGARSSDTAGLGDYTVNRQKLPDGIEGLARRIHGLGLDFGLWFEPESVNPDSALYRAHPEYAVAQPGRAPSYGRNQLLLDLTNPAVRDCIVENVTAILDRADIQYVKWDMNRAMSDLYSPCCPAGEFSHRYILGLYEVLGRIFRPRPHILLESCSSGGNRFDLGMLCFSPQIWASDDTDPIERLSIQKGLSYFYPLSTISAHVSQAPHQQTLRCTPLSTRFNVAAFGVLGYELDLGELSPEERRQAAAQIAFYKANRRTLQYGDFYRYDLADPHKDIFLAVEKDQSRACLAFIQTLSHAAESNDTLAVKGLLPEVRYRLETVPQKVALARFGGLLKHVLPVRLRADGWLLRTANRHYALPDGPLCLHASGGALQSGVGLNNQFIGTGYHKELRLWGDFGSQMYAISREDTTPSGIQEEELS